MIDEVAEYFAIVSCEFIMISMLVKVVDGGSL